MLNEFYTQQRTRKKNDPLPSYRTWGSPRSPGCWVLGRELSPQDWPVWMVSRCTPSSTEEPLACAVPVFCNAPSEPLQCWTCSRVQKTGVVSGGQKLCVFWDRTHLFVVLIDVSRGLIKPGVFSLLDVLWRCDLKTSSCFGLLDLFLERLSLALPSRL